MYIEIEIFFYCTEYSNLGYQKNMPGDLWVYGYNFKSPYNFLYKKS